MRIFLGCVGAVLIGTSASAAPLDLNDFVIYAQTGPVQLGSGTQIHSGAVGTTGGITANSNAEVNSLFAGAAIQLGSGNAVSAGSSVVAGGNITTQSNTVFGSGSSVVAGGNISFGSNAIVGAGSVVAGGNLTTQSNVNLTGVAVTVGGTINFSGSTLPPSNVTTASTPVPFSGSSPYQLPSLPAASISAPSSGVLGNINILANQSLALTPGEYGTLSGGSNASLSLTAGVYHFTSASLQSGFDINYDLSGGAIIVYVDGAANLASNVMWNLTGGDASDVYWELNGDFTVASGSHIYGTVYTASGAVANLGDETLGANVVFVGQLLATGGVKTNSNVELSLLVNDRFVSPGEVDPVAETPIPAALPLFAAGLGALGLLARRSRKRNQESSKNA